MEVDINNIYGDILNEECDLGGKIDKLQQQNILLQELRHSLELDAEKLRLKIIDMKKIQDKLSKNISELYKTAKAEVGRKDQMIAQLKSQLDNYISQPKRNNFPIKRTRDHSPQLGHHNTESIVKKMRQDNSENEIRGKHRSSYQRQNKSRSRSTERDKRHYRERSSDRKRWEYKSDRVDKYKHEYDGRRNIIRSDKNMEQNGNLGATDSKKGYGNIKIIDEKGNIKTEKAEATIGSDISIEEELVVIPKGGTETTDMVNKAVTKSNIKEQMVKVNVLTEELIVESNIVKDEASLKSNNVVRETNFPTEGMNVECNIPEENVNVKSNVPKEGIMLKSKVIKEARILKTKLLKEEMVLKKKVVKEGMGMNSIVSKGDGKSLSVNKSVNFECNIVQEQNLKFNTITENKELTATTDASKEHSEKTEMDQKKITFSENFREKYDESTNLTMPSNENKNEVKMNKTKIVETTIKLMERLGHNQEKVTCNSSKIFNAEQVVDKYNDNNLNDAEPSKKCNTHEIQKQSFDLKTTNNISETSTPCAIKQKEINKFSDANKCFNERTESILKDDPTLNKTESNFLIVEIHSDIIELLDEEKKNTQEYIEKHPNPDTKQEKTKNDRDNQPTTNEIISPDKKKINVSTEKLKRGPSKQNEKNEFHKEVKKVHNKIDKNMSISDKKMSKGVNQNDKISLQTLSTKNKENMTECSKETNVSDKNKKRKSGKTHDEKSEHLNKIISKDVNEVENNVNTEVKSNKMKESVLKKDTKDVEKNCLTNNKGKSDEEISGAIKEESRRVLRSTTRRNSNKEKVKKIVDHGISEDSEDYQKKVLKQNEIICDVKDSIEISIKENKKCPVSDNNLVDTKFNLDSPIVSSDSAPVNLPNLGDIANAPKSLFHLNNSMDLNINCSLISCEKVELKNTGLLNLEDGAKVITSPVLCDSDINSEILREDLNISFLEQSDVESTNKLSVANSLESSNAGQHQFESSLNITSNVDSVNSLSDSKIFNTSSGKKRRRVVLTMMD